MAEKRSDTSPREERRLAPYESRLSTRSPFRMLDRFAEEMDRLFDDFGVGAGALRPRFGRGWLPSPRTSWEVWAPEIEVFHRNNELVVRADLPGVKKNDVSVDVREDAITISGERRQEHEEERGGSYIAERSYGSFSRVIPLPQGAMTDQAKARFKDGVLEISMPAPPEQVSRGRRLEIAEESGK